MITNLDQKATVEVNMNKKEKAEIKLNTILKYCLASTVIQSKVGDKLTDRLELQLKIIYKQVSNKMIKMWSLEDKNHALQGSTLKRINKNKIIYSNRQQKQLK